MKQILVDMDGVLADVYAQFLRLEQEETGVLQPAEALVGKSEHEAFRHCDDYVRSDGFFRTAPLMEGAFEGLRYLNDRYRVLIVSSATEYPKSLAKKQAWLEEHFPFISWKQMIFCGEKDSIKGDIMLDDHPKNLDVFDGRKILFTQPHNALNQNPDYERVTGWEAVRQLL